MTARAELMKKIPDCPKPHLKYEFGSWRCYDKRSHYYSARGSNPRRAYRDWFFFVVVKDE